jgi:predicted Fe-Mo cluster-binding NifX family protein
MDIFIKKETVRIAIPVMGYDGLNSKVSAHFGNAPGFIVVDGNGSELTYLDTAKARRPSECAPVHALVQAGSKLVIASSMGRGAMERCHSAGLQILHAVGNTVAEVLAAYRSQHCPDFPDDALCAHHDHEGHDHHRVDCDSHAHGAEHTHTH